MVALLVALPARAEDAAIARLFADRGVTGTLVIASLRDGRTFVHDDARAAQRHPVASTFKILNSLIALEEKVIGGKDDVLRWDGRRHDFPDWNRDQTLESAFRVSCVWCYQELARRVGGAKYEDWLRRVGFGSLRTPFVETEFWLDGSLQASALEQVAFLRKVAQRSLPFSTSTYDTLRQIMLVEQGAGYAIRAKTGWAARATPQVGWYAGYAETADDVWLFATNLTVRGEADLKVRAFLTREALQAKGVLR